MKLKMAEAARRRPRKLLPRLVGETEGFLRPDIGGVKGGIRTHEIDGSKLSCQFFLPECQDSRQRSLQTGMSTVSRQKCRDSGAAEPGAGKSRHLSRQNGGIGGLSRRQSGNRDTDRDIMSRLWERDRDFLFKRKPTKRLNARPTPSFSGKSLFKRKPAKP